MNPLFSTHHTVSHRKVFFAAQLQSGAMAGISGAFFALQNGFVDLQMGKGVVLLAITALVLGKVILHRSGPTFWMPVVSLILFLGLQESLLVAGLNLNYFIAYQSCIVIGALALFSKRIKHDILGV